jgi:hypothetical protein
MNLPPDPDEFGLPDELGSNSDAALNAQLQQLPPDFYDKLSPLLLLGGVANFIVLGYPDDPVPLAIRELTGYDLDGLRLITNANNTMALGRVMARQPIVLHDFLAVAVLAFESRLDEPIRTYLQRHDTAAAGNHLSLREYVLDFGRVMLDHLSEYIARTDADLREEMRLRRLQLESIFARLGDTLRPYYPPGQELPTPAEATDSPQDQQLVLAVSFSRLQLMGLLMALTLTKTLPSVSERPFAQALRQVPGLGAPALEQLRQRLTALAPDEKIQLSWGELRRLYQSAQVCAISLVADVLPMGSVEDMLVQGLGPDDAPEESLPERTTPEQAHQYRDMIAKLMSGFIEFVDENFAAEPDLATARAAITDLTELLD